MGTTPMTRMRNERLAELLAEAGWSRAQAASAYNRIAREAGDGGGASIGRSHVSMWVGGTRPSGNSPLILCQALSRRLRREITPDELGLAAPGGPARWAADWSADPLTDMADLGRIDLDTDPRRRGILAGAAYSAAALALPDEAWWRTAGAAAAQAATDRAQAAALSTGTQAAGARSARAQATTGRARRVGRDDVLAVRQLTDAFRRIDQRHGGGHGRTALVSYLNSDVAALLRGSFGSDEVRRDMFDAAGELAYLAGWTAFDNAEHTLAQRYFCLALKLTAQADDPPLAGHILRAMAYQAVDLGFPGRSVELSAASMDGQRYLSATPRERTGLGIAHFRALAAAGERRAAAKALIRAEDDLASASDGIEEPPRALFFAEAALAHEAGRALRDCGDAEGAIEFLQRSVRTRGAAFRRTHALTLGHLGSAQFAAGRVDEACDSWGQALDVVEDGVHSARVRESITQMRTLISPDRYRQLPATAGLHARATTYLAQAS
jgi:tetratricopeptide (TPR) repeat protein